MKKLLLIIALLISTIGLNAQSVINDDLEFTVTSEDSAECEVLGYIGNPVNVIIPSTLTISGKEYTVTSIGEYAFYDCSSLTSIEIPNSVTFIGDYAFYYCSSLTSIDFGENSQLTFIGESAFSSCSSLTSIEIPSGVTRIGSGALGYCDSLTSIYCYAENVPETGSSVNVFSGVPSDMVIYVPAQSVDAYKAVSPWNVFTILALDETEQPEQPGEDGVEVLLFEDFESYETGAKIAESGAENWTTWKNKPGTKEDGVVAELEGNKCGYLTYGVDQVLLLGGHKTGVFDLEFDIYVPNGKGAYYNILHDFSGGNSTWALQAYLQMTDDGQANPAISDGHGSVHAGGSNAGDIPCVWDGWMHFRVRIDANTDRAEYYYTLPNGEETKAFDWQWSKDSFGESTISRKLGAMNFYPSTTNSEYYIDNLKLTRIGGAAAIAFTFSAEKVEASKAADDMTSVEFTVENTGEAIVDYAAWIDYGEGEMSDKYEMVSYALEDLTTTTAIGWSSTTEPMTFEIAALYPSSAYANSVMGTYITDAAYLLPEFKTETGETVPMLEPGTDMIFRIYSQGINGLPGEILAEKAIPSDSIIYDWNTVTFDEPVALTGFDFYFAVEMTQCVDGRPMVLDGNTDTLLAGYADLCRLSNTTAFKSLTEYTGGEAFGNWHLAIVCTGNPVVGDWAELSKNNGTLAIGANETIDIDINTYGLEDSIYEAKIVFVSNNTDDKFEIPLSLKVNKDTHKNIYITTNPEEAGIITGAGEYAINDTVTLIATANEGYQFINWTENDTVVSEEVEYTFVVTNDRYIIANFEKIANPEQPGEGGDDNEGDEPEQPGDEPEEPADPATPKNVVAEALSATTILLEWDAVKNAESYNVYQDGDLVDNVKSVVYKVKDLDADTEYCFTVVAVNEAGKSAKSEEACATTEPDAVSELVSSFNIYPNPVNDKIYIETEVEIEDVVVYDVYGRQQSTVNGQQTSSIDVSNLNSGVYFIKIKSNDKFVLKRFVKK